MEEDYWVPFFQIFWLSLMVSTTSMTIAKAKIFEKIREKIEKINFWLGKLISCPYCLSHWISLVFVAAYQPRIIYAYFFLDMAVSLFVIVELATFWSILVCVSMRLMDELGHQQRKE